MLWSIAMEIQAKQTFIHNTWQQLIPEAYEPETLNTVNAVEALINCSFST